MAPREAPSSAKRLRPRKRRANVYDAVQGRVTQAGLIGHVQSERASKKRLRPDEVLYKRKNAPVRYHETDDYPAHTQLPVDKQLPSRDLVAAIDGYVSNLYAKHRVPGTQKAHKFINETGLLAMGILMEEMARDIVGETGNLAFTEEPEDNKKMMQDRRDEKFNAKNRPWVDPTEKKSDYKLDWERKVRPTRKRRRGGKFGRASDDPDIADDPDNLDVSLEQWKATPGHEADDRRSLPGRGVPAKLLSNLIYPPNLQTTSDNSRTPEDAEDSEDAENLEDAEDSEDSEGSQSSDKNWLATLRLNDDLLLVLDDSDDLEVAGVPNENSSATLGLVKDLPMVLDHREITDDSDNLEVILEQLKASLGHGNDFWSALDDSEVGNDPGDSDVSLGQWSENLGHDDNFLKFFKGSEGPGGPESSEGSKGSEFPELPEYLETAADLEGPEVTDDLDVEGVEGTEGAEDAEDAEDSEFTDDSEGSGVTDDSDGARVSSKQWRANLGHHDDFLKYFEDLEDPEDPKETD